MIPTPQRYLVIHKPSKDDPPQYFGPFVSKSKAEEFSYKFPPETKTFVRPLLARKDAEDEQ